MISLADRLTGTFNIESIITPLDIKISDAIMNFQDSGFKITQRVFDGCGTPKLVSRRRRDAQPAADPVAEARSAWARPGSRLRSFSHGSVRGGKSGFEKLISDLRKTVIRESHNTFRQF